MSHVSLHCGICLSDVGEDFACVCVCVCVCVRVCVFVRTYALVCVAFVVAAASVGLQTSDIELSSVEVMHMFSGSSGAAFLFPPTLIDVPGVFGHRCVCVYSCRTFIRVGSEVGVFAVAMVAMSPCFHCATTWRRLRLRYELVVLGC